MDGRRVHLNKANGMMSENGKILIVDDEESVRISLGRILEKNGYSVMICSNGKEAVDLIRGISFDLVITDVKMQGYDGLRVLDEVKKSKPDTLVILMTGYASLESAIAAIRKGAYDYLVKPFQIETLMLVVKRSIDMKRLAENNKRLLDDLRKMNTDLEHANQELRKTQQKVLETERLAAISETIATLHHEINNPLMVMLVKIQLLHDRYHNSNEQLSQDLKTLSDLTLKVASILDKLKSISRPIMRDYLSEIKMLDIDHSD